MAAVEAGTLYVVGTPIGNLGDISARALEVMREVDFIAAEDTRVTRKLLQHYSVNKPLISCREHNIRRQSEEIADRLLQGEACAVVTDAGMPCISDPGEVLVQVCVERSLPISVVPGPSAVVSALAISGLSTSRFSFEGFLSVTKKQRFMHLAEIKDSPYTLVFYEAPHKLCATLADLLEVLGDRQIALCREMTKRYEQVLRGKISEWIAYYETERPRGEYVLVIAGSAKREEEYSTTLAEAAALARTLVEQGERPADACRQIAAITPYSKSAIYRLLTTPETD